MDQQKHPLYHSWKWYRERSKVTRLCEQWHKDFWTFECAVGARPSRQHRLMAIDASKELGPENFEWVEKKLTIKTGETEEAYRARAQRVRRKEHKEKVGRASLSCHYKRKYGIDILQYEEMVKERNGLCDICLQLPTKNIRGKLAKLHVDHCHETGRVRGLLCNRCNSGLNMFRENASIVEAARNYLLAGVSPA